MIKSILKKLNGVEWEMRLQGVTEMTGERGV